MGIAPVVSASSVGVSKSPHLKKAAAEALALGIEAGPDSHLQFDVISASSGASGNVQECRASVLQNDFEPHACAPILAKDMRLAAAKADASHSDPAIGDAALAIFGETLARVWGELGDAAITKIYLPQRKPRP